MPVANRPKNTLRATKRNILRRATGLSGTTLLELNKKGAKTVKIIPYAVGETSQVKALTWEDLKAIANTSTLSA